MLHSWRQAQRWIPGAYVISYNTFIMSRAAGISINGCQVYLRVGNIRASSCSLHLSKLAFIPSRYKLARCLVDKSVLLAFLFLKL